MPCDLLSNLTTGPMTPRRGWASMPSSDSAERSATVSRIHSILCATKFRAGMEWSTLHHPSYMGKESSGFGAPDHVCTCPASYPLLDNWLTTIRRGIQMTTKRQLPLLFMGGTSMARSLSRTTSGNLWKVRTGRSTAMKGDEKIEAEKERWLCSLWLAVWPVTESVALRGYRILQLFSRSSRSTDAGANAVP
jgi:hypothetical protein